MENSILPPMNEIVLENRRRTSHLRAAAFLSLASGSMMLISGVAARDLILDILLHGSDGFVVQSISILISSFLILSGMFFFLGGLMLVYKQYSFGRPLVALAGGLSIFTLAFCLVLAYMNSNFSIASSLVSYPEYFLGILLASGSTAIELQTDQAF